MPATAFATFQAYAAQDWANFIGPRGFSQAPFTWIELSGAALGWQLNRRRARLTRLAGAFIGAVFLVWLYKAHIYANYDPATLGAGMKFRPDYAERFAALFKNQYTFGVLTDGWAFLLGSNAVGFGSIILYILARWRDGDRVTLRAAAKREQRGLRRWRRAVKAYEWQTRKLVQLPPPAALPPAGPPRQPAPVAPPLVPETVTLPPARARAPDPTPLPTGPAVSTEDDLMRRLYGVSSQSLGTAGGHSEAPRRTGDGLASANMAQAVAAAGAFLVEQETARQAAPLAPPPPPPPAPAPGSSLPITTTLRVPPGHVLVQLGGNYMIVPLTALPPVLRLDAKRLCFGKMRGFFGGIVWCINAVLNTVRTALWLMRAAITLALPITLLVLWFYGKSIMYWGLDKIVELFRYLLHQAAPSIF